MEQQPDHSIVLVREFDASSGEVYAAWTNPERVKRWWGKVTAEVRVGGQYRVQRLGDDGTVQVYTGMYRVLEPGRRVVQTFLAGEPELTGPASYNNETEELRLRPLGPAKTEVTVINGWDGEAISEEFQEIVRSAWSEWLDRLEGAVGVSP